MGAVPTGAWIPGGTPMTDMMPGGMMPEGVVMTEVRTQVEMMAALPATATATATPGLMGPRTAATEGAGMMEGMK